MSLVILVILVSGIEDHIKILKNYVNYTMQHSLLLNY